MLAQIKDGNVVKIEGILSEVELDYKDFTKNGATVKAIGGVIKVRVDTVVNGGEQTLEIPVHMFAAQLTNAGAPNPAYESIERIMNEYQTRESIRCRRSRRHGNARRLYFF